MDERILKAEILAPVGAPDRLQAAVRCGANAVYLGTGDFNARRNAANFDHAALTEAVSYCHTRDVKVHVTLNTLVMDDELGALEREAERIAASGADAVIIQDLAVLLFVEIDLFVIGYALFGDRGFVKKALNDASFEKMLADYYRNVFGSYARIERSFRIYDDKGSVLTEALAPGFYYSNFFYKAG